MRTSTDPAETLRPYQLNAKAEAIVVATAPYTLPFLNLGGSDMDVGEVHDIADRGADGHALKAKVDGWYMSQLAYLEQALDATPEGSGTTLNNSLLVMGNAQAEGSTHRLDDIPFVLVGAAGGALRTGRVVRVGRGRARAPTPGRARGAA
jgi:hypothetical protein